MGLFQFMITRIKLEGVASYKKAAFLDTDKKVNLVYGLNGSGKSTFSNHLYDMECSCYSNCSIVGLNDDENILVYNQRFIRDNFYQSDTLKGIFTLSKGNKDIEEKIQKLSRAKVEKNKEKDKKLQESAALKQSLQTKTEKAQNKIWEIKTTYAGGDRILEFCLQGKMGRKQALFEHVAEISMPQSKPAKSIEELKREAETIKGANVQQHEILNTLSFNEQQVESSSLLKKVIIGNRNSVVADLITKLQNADWVRQGLNLLPEKTDNRPSSCPFCQQKTITDELIDQINNYFDESYDNSVEELKNVLAQYESAKNIIPTKESYLSHPLIKEDRETFEQKYENLINIINDNIRSLKEKIKAPSVPIELKSTTIVIQEFNQHIEYKNRIAREHNEKLNNKENALSQIQSDFWKIIRWNYDQTIDLYQSDEERRQIQSLTLKEEISTLESEIRSINSEISENQKKIVNVEQAVESINNSLKELGIDGFEIIKHEDNLYKLKRDEVDNDTFQTLSEGEKMIISFLYFVELCRGKHSPTDTRSKRTVVIDDPVSSLSHVFVFNIGQLIKREFFNGNYEQIFVLTHSLYFFYELTDTNHNRRKNTQNLFRIHKNNSGSQIEPMKYEEIQNDYQSYWQIVNDDQQHPALVANCMRNIIEYFFNFVEKTDLNNVFQKESLRNDKYQAFCRYMNRESHSLGQNIFDMKEFNYTNFKDALKLVFQETGYVTHYKKMVAVYNT